MLFNLSKQQADRIIRVLHSTDDPRDQGLVDIMSLQAACGPSAATNGSERTLNALLDEAMAYEAAQFDADHKSDLNVSEANLLVWFAGWRLRLQAARVIDARLWFYPDVGLHRQDVQDFLNRASDRIEHHESGLPFPADVGRLVLAWLKGMAS